MNTIAQLRLAPKMLVGSNASLSTMEMRDADR
jgi:hypothetical protein